MPDQPHLKTLMPVLLIPNLTETVSYYQLVFGFTTDFIYGDPPFYASVSRDAIPVHMREIDEPITHNRRESIDTVDVYIVVTGVDKLHEELVNRGAKITYNLTTQDYGMREFYVEDLNGYRLGFGERVG